MIFFFLNGYFPAYGGIPNFIKIWEFCFSAFLYEIFRNSSSNELISTYYLAALNNYLKGDPRLSKDAMTKFFHNLSMEALCKSDDSVFLKFESMTELVKSYILLNQNIFDFNLGQDILDEHINTLANTFDFIKENPNIIGDEVVDLIIKDKKIDMPEDDE